MDSATQKLDLTIADGVRDYIQGTPFSSHGDIVMLSGGVTNFVYRVKLDEPFRGKATVIIKHAKPYVRSWVELPLELSRQGFEVEALRRVKPIIPDDALVTVPEVYLFDEKECVIIMEDAGADSVPLKQFMIEGRLSVLMAERLGTALGEFAGRLHVWGKDPNVLEYFEGHKMAKELFAWVNYGRLYQAIDPSKESDVAALRDPPLEHSEEDLAIIKKVGEDMAIAVKNAKDTFVMGDFWPGNMAVCATNENALQRVYMLDWEICRPGLAGIEIGQFCSEIDCVRHFYPQYKAAATKVISAFRDAYDRVGKPEKSVWIMGSVHWGTHLVVTAPRAGWGGREATRKVVEAGKKIIVQAHNGQVVSDF
ncbi:hypothetical protein AMATHDRAFT_143692 [Amanita thiersii Skay4041]|uniref:Aminoglycoside phosphotransferase domain-containing protein n=1 Tax=Amanita thiersii Skay4041 TaxID=703135 RepID=A0A2A9NRS2_9AGAR|nr:hypothetical protein AMATHDRAFT_143692 [Amanita thiersii Skay4041]